MSNAIFAPVLTAVSAGFESSSGTTPEFAAFAKKFRASMKKALEDQGAKLVSFNRGHFECSGFYKLNDRMGYFSIMDVRMGRSGPADVMFRTAEHERDFTGGPNNWANYDDNLAEKMVRLLS